MLFREPFGRIPDIEIPDEVKQLVAAQALDIFGDKESVGQAIEGCLNEAEADSRDWWNRTEERIYRLAGSGLREWSRPIADEIGEFADKFAPVWQEMRYLEAAREALRKLHEPEQLTPVETIGFKAIIGKVGRPAIPIQNGSFTPPSGMWHHIGAKKQNIELVVQSVGRIEVAGASAYPGTGFLVAPDLVMTNKHVATSFSREEDTKWTFYPSITVWIDYVEELGSRRSAEYVFTDVVGMHPTYDMALLRAKEESKTGEDAPSPLKLAANAPQIPNHAVYTVGYPRKLIDTNPFDIMEMVFSGLYTRKVLSPGELRVLSFSDDDQKWKVTHDCSTLRGHSGSPVFDLDTHLVVAVHFTGEYEVANEAVPLWVLRNDPFLTRHDITFT